MIAGERAGTSGTAQTSWSTVSRRRLHGCLGVLAIACAMGCSNRLFLHPRRGPSTTSATRIEIERTRGPGRRRPVEAFVQSVRVGDEPPGAYVLAFTGNAGRAENELLAVPDVFARWLDAEGPLHDRGMTMVAVNYPGFGSSPDPGPATLRRLGAAALDSYDHVAELAGDVPVVVYGISMGTTAALHIARSRPENPPAALVLDRGPDVPGIVMGRFGWWNLWLAAGPVTLSLPRSVRSVANARRVEDVPALFVLGTEDTLVTPRNGGRVAERYRGPKQVVWLPIGHGSWVDAREHAELRGGFDWLWAQVADEP